MLFTIHTFCTVSAHYVCALLSFRGSGLATFLIPMAR